MDSFKKKGKNGVDALLEATKEWTPYSGATYDELRTKADRQLAAQRSILGKRSPHWYEIWRWPENPCRLVGCMETKHRGAVGRTIFLVSTAVACLAGLAYTLVPPLAVPKAICALLGFAAMMVAVAVMDDHGLGLRDWKIHSKDLDRMRSGVGHAEMLVAYMLTEVRKSRLALIGDDKKSSPLRGAQLKLAVRLEEIQALAVRLKASLAREKDARLRTVLRSGLNEAAALEKLISGMKAKVEERIAQIKAFFDECEARIHGLEAPVLVMAMSHELALHRSAAEQETLEAEAAIAHALFELQSTWLAFQQTANTLLPQALAKVFGETGSDGDEKQNLAALEAAMDRVFDTLPALPEKRISIY